MDSGNIIVRERSAPLSKFPKMNFGNMPNDGGGLILSTDERKELINQFTKNQKYIRVVLKFNYLIFN